jgi:hypothetical protein
LVSINPAQIKQLSAEMGPAAIAKRLGIARIRLLAGSSQRRRQRHVAAWPAVNRGDRAPPDDDSGDAGTAQVDARVGRCWLAENATGRRARYPQAAASAIAKEYTAILAEFYSGVDKDLRIAVAIVWATYEGVLRDAFVMEWTPEQTKMELIARLQVVSLGR